MQATAPDNSLATLLIAVSGLALAVASLTWQAATFILSGSRVRAEFRHGARNESFVVSGLPGTQSLEALANQGFREEVLGVMVRNVGRLAASVTAVRAVLPDGVKISPTTWSGSPSLPHRLDPQSSESWFMPVGPVKAAIAASRAVGRGKDPTTVSVEVELGSGKVVKTPQRLTIASGT